MIRDDHKIEITKRNDGNWTCVLQKALMKNGVAMEIVDKIEETNFQDLMIEIGNRGWIDLINKNKKKS